MKPALVVLLLLTIASASSGQDGVTTFGFKVGALSPALRGGDVNMISNAGPAKGKQGITFGVFANSRLGKYFWLKHEVMYSVRSMNILLKDSINPVYQTNYVRHTIDIFPMSPSFHFKGLQVFAGPYLGVLSQAWIDRKDPSGNLYKDNSIFGNASQYKKQHQKFDFGFCVGVEYELPFGLNIGAKYVKGFVPVIEYSNSIFYGASGSVINIYNSYVVATIGYSFVKKEKKEP